MKNKRKHQKADEQIIYMDNDLHCDPMRFTRNVRLIIVISYIYDFIIIRHSGSIRVPVFGPY